MKFWSRRLVAVFAMLAMVASACGDDDDGVSAAGQAPEDAPTVVVTTNILGDVVQNIAGDQLQVVTLMPVGADPHDFQASAQQVAQIGEADVLIVNGESFEEGLLDVIESAETDGVAVYEAISTVSTIEFGEGGHDHGHDEDHEGEDHDHEDHEHEGEDGEHKDDEHADEDHDHEGEDHEHEGEDGEHKDDEHADEDHDHEHDEACAPDDADCGADHEHEDEDHEHEGEDGEHKDDEHADEDHDHEGEDHEHEGEDGEHKDEEHADEDHDDHEGEDEGHADEDHDDHDHDEHGHSHDGDDPHFWTDPERMSVAVDGIADYLIANVVGIDADVIRANADAYIGELEALDAEVEETLAGVESRVIITNHDSFGYFADRYGFEVAGTIIPSGSTLDGTSAQQLASLTELIQDEGVPAIFAETTVSDELAQTLAAEVGNDIGVVELYTGSLGDADSDGATYIEMIRTNAERIAAALGA